MYYNLGDWIKVTYKRELDMIIYKIEVLDLTLIWKNLEINISRNVLVKNKEYPINKSLSIHKKTIKLDSQTIDWEFDFPYKDFYSYTWKDIDITLSLDLRILNKNYFDYEYSIDIILDTHKKPSYELYENNHLTFDKISYREMFWLFNLTTKQKIKKHIYIIATSFIVSLIFVLFVIITDKSMVYNVWWKNEDLIFYYLIIPLLVTIYSLYKIDWYFSNMVTFKWKPIVWNLEKGKNYKLRDFVTWISKYDLNNLTIKVVAYNTENWLEIERETTRDKNWNETTKDVVNRISNKFNHQNIFEKKISLIPSWEPLDKYIDDTIVFDKVFDNIYNPQMSYSTHWVDMKCEIILMSDVFYDKKISIWKHKFYPEK